jgi:hypothetical protein
MRRRGFRLPLLVALGLTAFGTVAPAQDAPQSLRLEGLVPVGGRSTLTDGWGTLRFTVENRGAEAREARVVVFYPERRDVQFARDVWVPGGARATSWLPVGPPPERPSRMRRDIYYQLYERVDGEFRPVGSSQPDRLPSRAEPYRPREPTTAVYTDSVVGEFDDPDLLAVKDSAAEAVALARTFRHARGLSEAVSIVLDRRLPPTPEAFDGIDQFVLAGDRLAADPVGRQALRHWVLHGGTLWVMLDRVDPDVVAPVLGEGQSFQVVGRTSLTTVRLRGATEDPAHAQTREFDRPVEMVRVLLSGSETVLYEANGWPAAFSQPVGRGQVVFTTLGARGWHRPRTPRDGPSRFENAPDLPVPRGALEGLAGKLYPEPRPEALRPDDLAPMLTAEVGYEVVGRGTAAAILAGFVLGVLALGVWLRRSRSPELIGLAAPALALAVAVAFVAIGASSRRAVPPTAASVAVVEVSPDSGEAEWRGLFAVYSPRSGAVQIGTERGGQVELDPTGLEGQTRRRVQTDLDAWHWEDLAFPAGVRLGPFRSTTRTGVSAAGRFGPRGLEGRLTAGAFRNPADAVVFTRSGTALAARLEADGTFRAAPDDVLPTGQYLPGAILTDRQQRRQDVYRKLARPGSALTADRDRLLVWAESDDVPFAVGGAERTVSAALLVVPIKFGPPPGGVSVTIPEGFLPYTAVRDGRSVPPTMEANMPARARLRFQLPPSIRHLAVERATLVARVHAPGRKFSVAGVADGRPVPLHEALSPGGGVRVEITDARLLRPDPAGGLVVETAVSERIDADGRERPLKLQEPDLRWQIESLGLEVVGRAEGE